MNHDQPECFHDNGLLYKKYTIIDGIKHGPAKWYFNNGNLWFDFYYTNDKIDKMDQTWIPNKTRDFIRQYKLGNFNGPKIKFNYV